MRSSGQNRSKKPGYLYHILPFHYLVEIFENQALSLSCPKSWDDPYESVLDVGILDSIFAQCWCRLGVSDAMWRIYSKDQLSVRIKTTVPRLRAELETALSKDDRFTWRMGTVDYQPTPRVKNTVRQHLTALGATGDAKHALDSLFIKRKAFEHEAEYRIAVFSRHPLRDKPRLTFSVNAHRIILSVLVDPRAPDRAVNVYKYYLKSKLAFRGPVGKSELYARVEPPEV